MEYSVCFASGWNGYRCVDSEKRNVHGADGSKDHGYPDLCGGNLWTDDSESGYGFRCGYNRVPGNSLYGGAFILPSDRGA